MNKIIPFEPENYGEAMLALTENQRNFVIALVEQGGRNAMRAYMRALGTSEETAHRNAWRMNTPAVMAAVREEADRRLRGGAVLGASVLIEIAEDVMHKDRFKAASRLLDQAGLIVATEHRVTVEDKRSTAEILKSIGRFAKSVGHELPTPLAKHIQTIEDAEFEELSSEGLEDIL